MIREGVGSIFDSGADWLVCPVNCQPGVMGAGLAKAFADRFPWLKAAHRRAVMQGDLRMNSVCIVETPLSPHEIVRRREIVLFPTKWHWRQPSRLDNVASALDHLGIFACKFLRIGGSIAVPALGCGLGSLPWDLVRPEIERVADDNDLFDWIVYPPQDGR